MKSEMLSILLLGSSFLALFYSGEFLLKFFHLPNELTRKWVHVGTGILTMLFPIYLHSHWSVLALCASFAVLLFLSIKYGWFPAIHKIERKSHGSLLYPLAVYSCFLLLEKLNLAYVFYALPLLTMAISDPIAAMVGTRFPFGRFKTFRGFKSLSGCLAFFLSSFILALLFLPNSLELSRFLTVALIVGFTATLAEAMSGLGIDNLSIPVAVWLSLYFLLPVL
jgi:phytol kinase